MSESTKEQIQEIFNSHQPPELAHAMSCAWLIAEQKGENLKVFNVSEKSSLAHFYVLASTQNKIQSQTISDRLRKFLKEKTSRNITVEGEQEAQWILVDFGSVIVHLFQESTRSIYDLDELWKEYPQVEIPEHYYFSKRGLEASQKDPSNQYF